MAKDFSIAEIEDLINLFYGGVFSSSRLPLDLYNATVERLTDAVERGFGDFNPDDVVLTDLFQNFEHNVGAFSAAKTFQQSLDIERALFSGGFKRPFGEFKAEAAAIFDEYNRNWLKAEYRTAYNNALGARQWLDLKENADIAPLLRYDTAGDERVRKEHEELDGITLHIDHPFWKTNFPPNGWNCRCTVTQYALDEAEQTPADKLKGIPEPPKLFALNPAIDKVIFSPTEHPYFNVADRYKVQALNNFGLPVKPKPKPPKPDPGKQIQRLPFPERLKIVREKMLSSVDQYEVDYGDLLIERAAQRKILSDNEISKGEQFAFSKLPVGSKSWNELGESINARQQKQLEAFKKIAEVESKIKNLKIVHEDRIVEILAQDEPLAMNFKAKNASLAPNDFVNRGITAFRRIVGKKNIDNLAPGINFNNTWGRAHFRTDRAIDSKMNRLGLVKLHNNNSIETVCHELGHWLEISNLSATRANIEFFNRRTYGLSARPLRMIYPTKGYRSTEIAIEDDFFNAYSGKIYTGGHYETLTMWFSHVLGDPLEMRDFLLKDPDHFETYLKLFYETL